MNNEIGIDEPFSLLQYIKENFVGLLLLLLVFLIIYFVDHISRINALIFAMPSPMQGIQVASNNIAMAITKKIKKVKK